MPKARRTCANPVMGIGFEASSIVGGVAEILVYGTTVVVKKAEETRLGPS